MKESKVFTSSLPLRLLSRLEDYSTKFSIPKNKILENALIRYFEQIKKAEYAHSFKRAQDDNEISMMAEEGLEDYLKILEE